MNAAQVLDQPITVQCEEHRERLIALKDFLSDRLVGCDVLIERLLIGLLADGHLLIEGAPGPRQDPRRQGLRGRPQRLLRAHPVHARPDAGRHHRHAGLAPGQRHLRVRRRAGLPLDRARRRDQPRAAEGAVRAARGDGGAAGDGRVRHLSAARSVPGARDAQPDRAGGHLSAARGGARPLPPPRHPRPAGRAGRAPHPRPRRARERRRPGARARAGRDRRREGGARGRAARPPRARPQGVHRAPRHGDAGRARGRRRARRDRVPGLAARHAGARGGRQGARLSRRARSRDAGRRRGARRRGAEPPPRAELAGASPRATPAQDLVRTLLERVPIV